LASDAYIPCKLHCRRARTSPALDAVSEVFARRQSASIMGANSATISAEGFSYWAAEPKEVFEFNSWQTDPFERLHEVLSKYKLTGDVGTFDGTFRGGWIGYFSYELGRYIETLPQTTLDDLEMPLIRLCFYDRFVAYDHNHGAFWLVALERPDDKESAEQKFAWLEQRMEESQGLELSDMPEVGVESVCLSGFATNMSQANYLQAVQHIKRYIRDGEVYQVNFSQRFDCPFMGRPIDLFHWQNRFNPSPYATYIDAGSHQIVSASPELFIDIHNGRIQTKPIKGTRPRLSGDDPHSRQINKQYVDELLTSEKEQAELNMIVDLERNDLARICRPGTRHVVQPRTIETCPTVFHAVATVAGELRADVGFTDVLKAVFPGGSITGAPKIRAMEIIDELEPTARGVYTGGIGFVGLDGAACLNIAIRTIIITAGKAFVQAGGGIVADSDPQAEWEESLTKARALLAGIQAVCLKKSS
jgi:para-aminobenzoate synthetase component I